MSTDHRLLPPGSTVGILGGGQLGRMLALAAARLGVRTHIYCPDPDSPAFDVASAHTMAAYDDEAALRAFATSVDVVTYEFENVPVATAEIVAATTPLRPGIAALKTAQDRLLEKAFIARTGATVAAHRPVETLEELRAAIGQLALPAVLKTTRMGYDGKGQAMLRAEADLEPAFARLAPRPLVLEAFVPFEKEISVVVARGLTGEVRAYDPAENLHQHHILRTSTVPAQIAASTAAEAVWIAEQLVTALDYVGVMGIEFFVLPSGRLVVNEIAPRVHNSGHWTEAVCATDQFEQHIRAILGWPLGDPARRADVVMANLIGDDVLAATSRLGPNTRLHLYGKADVRPGRKMGHINRIGPPVRQK